MKKTICFFLIKLQLFDKPSESEVGTQTDYFLDRPSTPPYCPGKTGTDVETQIDPGDVCQSILFCAIIIIFFLLNFC